MEANLTLAEMRAEFERLENQETEIDEKLGVLLKEKTLNSLYDINMVRIDLRKSYSNIRAL